MIDGRSSIDGCPLGESGVVVDSWLICISQIVSERVFSSSLLHKVEENILYMY